MNALKTDCQCEASPKSRRYIYGLVITTIAFLLAFASANLPVPLYAQLQNAHPNITDAHISLTMFTYLVGVVTMLVFSGKLSDIIGRKIPTIAAMTVGAMACMLFLRVSNPATLLAMRFMHGIACGLTMGPMSAYIIDLSGERHAALARTIVGTFPMLGVALGPVGIGIWNTLNPDYSPIFLACIAMQILLAVVLMLSPETVPTQGRPPLKSMIKNPISFPAEIRHVFPVAGIAYVVTWGLGTYFQAFSALVATDMFGSAGTLLGAIILVLSMCPSALGGPIEARMPQGTSLRVGLWLFTASAVAMCVFMTTEWLAPFIGTLIIFSLSMGISLAGSLRVLYAAAPNAGNATIISFINLVAYAGCAVINIAISSAVNHIGLLGSIYALSFVSVVPSIFCILISRRLLPRD